MQTFLPYLDFKKSAKALDRQRLGKQRVECLQILKSLAGQSDGWQYHPNVTRWQGYELVLVDYACYICEEWLRRGYKDTCLDKILDLLGHNAHWLEQDEWPEWLTEEFCQGHRELLLSKNEEWYSQYGWNSIVI